MSRARVNPSENHRPRQVSCRVATANWGVGLWEISDYDGVMSAAILVMSADARHRELLRRVAEEFGRVVVTHKPSLAIYFAAVHEPRLAILDFDAVPESGRSGLVSTLRVRFGASLIATGEIPTLGDAAELGLPMLLKPVDVADLTTAIQRGLTSRQPGDAARQ